MDKGLAPGNAGLKPLAQRLEALRAGDRKSVLTDFHVLRQDFSPTGAGSHMEPQTPAHRDGHTVPAQVSHEAEVANFYYRNSFL